MTSGLARAGYKPAFAVDPDPLARQVYASNFGFEPKHSLSLNTGDVPHPEIVAANFRTGLSTIPIIIELIKKIQSRAVILELPKAFRALDKIDKVLDYANYRGWYETLDAYDFRVPQRRKSVFVVGLRKDVVVKFSAFPFPDPTGHVTMETILDENPSDELILTEAKAAKILAENEKNKTTGVGFRHKILGPDDVAPCFPQNYFKGSRGVFVSTPKGPRNFSLAEVARLMGFASDYAIPIQKTDALRLLAVSSCPPVIEAIAKEIKDWLI